MNAAALSADELRAAPSQQLFGAFLRGDEKAAGAACRVAVRELVEGWNRVILDGESDGKTMK